MYLISACLAGMNCKYNGDNNYHEVFEKLVKENKAVPLCPEQVGGLSTPRTPAEIQGGDGLDVIKGKARVVTSEGKDVTCSFLTGAKEALKLARIIGAEKAILKSKSPSCGCCEIYDGSFKGVLKEGMGVTAAYLFQNGIRVIDSDEFLKSK
ncbi:MAG: hypothetical protein PWQ60_2016 [Thermoanaerobacteraceae bacterium]|jgi:uncharacterized protein YbbK (DUF523 family)|nr:hypothetical protein [Thermoanaerobacteraceae bacterium]RKL61554.1 DUF523 domain-containing protein [Thermoanaerobacteraceae bacterium SP2]